MILYIIVQEVNYDPSIGKIKHKKVIINSQEEKH